MPDFTPCSKEEFADLVYEAASKFDSNLDKNAFIESNSGYIEIFRKKRISPELTAAEVLGEIQEPFRQKISHYGLSEETLREILSICSNDPWGLSPVLFIERIRSTAIGLDVAHPLPSNELSSLYDISHAASEDIFRSLKVSVLFIEDAETKNVVRTASL